MNESIGLTHDIPKLPLFYLKISGDLNKVELKRLKENVRKLRGLVMHVNLETIVMIR